MTKRILLLVPVSREATTALVAQNLEAHLKSLDVKVATIKPIPQDNPEALKHAENLLRRGLDQVLMEEVVEKVDQVDADIVIVEGLSSTAQCFYTKRVNRAMALGLDAMVLLISKACHCGAEHALTQAEIEVAELTSTGRIRVVGHVLDGEQAEEVSAAFKAQKLSVVMSMSESVQYDDSWLTDLVGVKAPLRLTPPRFRAQLIHAAKKNLQRIVLPEGIEPRTLKAANIVADRGIAIPVLIARPGDLRNALNNLGMELAPQVQVIDPDLVREKYVEPMVELRKAKGLTTDQARHQLLDDVVLGTMMVKQGDVSGLVSGALHTTADTVRPALQLIKCKPGVPSISSVFFMCLPDQVMVYGDCAIAPNPDANELSQIAIQSADTAKAFGIEPRVAMISYSTGTSGSGPDVEIVREATAKIRELRPDIVVDGPIQYDAAINESVARSKAPQSPLKGRATVIIFPDLNTGNCTYKAVQRSANLESIGPLLQGLAKPVNDLSRGALVDDIVYTIALTAIQAQQEV